MVIDLTKDNVVFDGCEANIDRATGETVSYTHLTLPTK